MRFRFGVGDRQKKPTLYRGETSFESVVVISL